VLLVFPDLVITVRRPEAGAPPRSQARS